MATLDAIEERLRHAEGRLDSTHTSIGTLRGQQSNHAIELAVLHNTLQGITDDIGEVRVDIAAIREDFGTQMRWINRGLWAGASFFVMLIVAVVTLLTTSGGPA